MAVVYRYTFDMQNLPLGDFNPTGDFRLFRIWITLKDGSLNCRKMKEITDLIVDIESS